MAKFCAAKEVNFSHLISRSLYSLHIWYRKHIMDILNKKILTF